MPVRAHVLSIQDNDGDTRLLQEIWGKDSEIKLTCRATGALGVEHLQTEHQRIPNLIVLAGRFALSQMTTLEVLHALKADPQLRCIPVIVFSGADPETIFSFYDAYASCVIEIPLTSTPLQPCLPSRKHFGLELRDSRARRRCFTTVVQIDPLPIIR